MAITYTCIYVSCLPCLVVRKSLLYTSLINNYFKLRNKYFQRPTAAATSVPTASFTDFLNSLAKTAAAARQRRRSTTTIASKGQGATPSSSRRRTRSGARSGGRCATIFAYCTGKARLLHGGASTSVEEEAYERGEEEEEDEDDDDEEEEDSHGGPEEEEHTILV